MSLHERSPVSRLRLVVLTRDKREPEQKTQPKKGKPIDIPVPKRSDFDSLLKRAEVGRQSRASPKLKPGMGGGSGQPKKPSGLFYLVVGAVLIGAVAAVFPPNDKQTPGFALRSNFIYHLEIGLATLAVFYVVGMALWLAWHGKGFFKLPAGIEAPDPDVFDDAADDLEADKGDIEVLRTELSEGLSEIDKRVSELEAAHERE